MAIGRERGREKGKGTRRRGKQGKDREEEIGREELCAVVIFAATVATVTIANTKGRIAARCSGRESDSTTTIHTHYRRREIIATTAPASGGQSDLTLGRTAADRSIEFTRCRRRAAQLMHGSLGPRESAPANGNSIGSGVLQRTLVCPTYKHATSKQTCHSLNLSIKVFL